jgi:bifunctional DNA-binding transcriptional regulator/antitoxin component of YhaV-PrlF toxin-antitoxin module
MARVRLSDDGDLHVPLALREALGLVPGGEVDVTESEGRLVVVPVLGKVAAKPVGRRLTIEQLLAMAVPYDGPPITDEMMHEAIDREAVRMWTAFEKQSSAHDHD